MDQSELEVFGTTLEELPDYVGSLEQVAGIEQYVHAQGSAYGTRGMRIKNGGGLEFELLPDRALDIGAVSFRGIPIAWLSPTGFADPATYDATGSEWLRTFGGGLLATCGLDTFGPESRRGNELFPMHGRIGAQRSTVTTAEVRDGIVKVAGEVRQSSVLKENLKLEREISTALGSNVLLVKDRVTNQGMTPVGHMVLYHCNFGWPLLSPTMNLVIKSKEVVARDSDAEAGLHEWSSITGPIPGYKEQVFRHDFSAIDEPVEGKVLLDNPTIDLSVEMAFSNGTLPGLHQWKLTGQGHYVLGIEPTNTNWSHGRVQADEQGIVPMLERGESVEYWLSFTFGPSKASLEKGRP